MSPKYNAQYRLPYWHYGWNGSYFVTMCTKGRELLFGDVVDTEMQLSALGQIAHRDWLAMPDHFSYVMLDDFVVMPNHVHGILHISNSAMNHMPFSRRRSGGINSAATATTGTTTGWYLQPDSQSISTVIRHYKAGVTRKSKQLMFTDTIWQRRFHDRVVRNEHELDRIRRYIIDNPRKWHEDRNSPSSRHI